MSGSVKELREDVPSVKVESGLSEQETRLWLAARLKEYEEDQGKAKNALALVEEEYAERVKPLKLQLLQYQLVIDATRNCLWKMSQGSKL